MLATFAPIAALLSSVALLIMGNGLQGTLLPVRANLEQFSTAEIGLVGTAYFAGFGLGCYFGGRIVRRAGHIRTFSAMASLASAIVLVHAVFLTPALWWLLRAATGFCFAVLYVVVESWLNERSTNENRGLILSIYTIINLTVITVGQMMLTLSDPRSFPLFILASVLVSMAVLPLALTTAPPPAPLEKVQLRLRYLYGVSPVGFVGALAIGTVNGSFWSMGPVFAQDSGLGTAGIAGFMSLAVLAGALAQYPFGRLSDRLDRRRVIALVSAIGAIGAGAIVALPWYWPGGTLYSAVLFGAMAFPLYAVCVAHTNDFVDRDAFVETSSVLLLLYALGASLGPIPASLLMGRIGPGGLFLFTALVHGGYAVFVLYRLRLGHMPTMKERFVTVPRTSPTLFALDPRGAPLAVPEAGAAAAGSDAAFAAADEASPGA